MADDNAVAIDDAGRKALRAGDVVRMTFRGNVTQYVVTTAPWCADDWWCVGLSGLTYPLDRVTAIVSTASPRDPAPAAVDPRDAEIAALKAKVAGLVAACEPFVADANRRSWLDTNEDTLGIDGMNIGGSCLTNGDLRALRAAVEAAKA